MNQPLAETIFWIAVAACAVAEIAILRFTFASHRASKSELVPSSSRSGEIAWAILPAIGLILLLGATWQRIAARRSHMDMMEHPGMQHPMQMSSAALPPGAPPR